MEAVVVSVGGVEERALVLSVVGAVVVGSAVPDDVGADDEGETSEATGSVVASMPDGPEETTPVVVDAEDPKGPLDDDVIGAGMPGETPPGAMVVLAPPGTNEGAGLASSPQATPKAPANASRV